MIFMFSQNIKVDTLSYKFEQQTFFTKRMIFFFIISQISMKTPFLISQFIIVFIFLAVTNSEIVTISSSGCILDIQRNQSNSTDDRFQLKMCYWHTLFNPLQQSSDWSICTNECCDPKKYYLQTQRQLGRCNSDYSEYIKLQYQKYGTIAGALALSIITPICVFCCCNKISRRQSQPINSIQSNEIIQLPNRQQKNPLANPQIIKWQMSNKNCNDVCPICLENGPEVELQPCKHRIHGLCWRQQSDLKKQCASCRTNYIKTLKIYCKKCFKHYFNCTYKDWKNAEPRTYTCIVCQRQ